MARPFERPADLCRVVSELAPDAAALTLIKVLLGGDPEWVAPEDAPAEPPKQLADPLPRPIDLAERAQDPDPSDNESFDAGSPLPIEVRASQVQRTSPPAWIEQARTKALVDEFAKVGTEPTIEPILPIARSRAVLCGALSMPGRGEIDLPKVVNAIASSKALASLPRRLRPTLAGGAQILVDSSEAMLSFSHDVRQLRQQLSRLLGGAAASTAFFDGCPLVGCGVGSRREWSPYGMASLPRWGSRVFCITDMGLGTAVMRRIEIDVESWVQFARTVRQGGCDACVLTPYPPSRFPRQLRRVMQLLHWDPTLTATAAIAGLRHRGALREPR